MSTWQCAFCGTLAKDQQLHFCSGCRQRKYCNEACQRAAWRAGHKDECRLLRTTSSASASSSSSSASAAVASPSQRPGAEGGGKPDTSPAPTTAVASTRASAHGSSSTKKKTKKSTASKTDPTNGPAASDEPQTTHVPENLDGGKTSTSNKKTGVKTMWVTIFKCFNCGKRGHDLSKCARCEEAYYCGRDCQIAHARAHAKVCVATVAAKAQRAHRERIARAVREDGKDKVEGGEEDELCVICQAKPVNAVALAPPRRCPQRSPSASTRAPSASGG